MSIEVTKSVPLASHTTLQVGGPASYYVEVKDETQLLEAVAFAHENQLSITVLGGGSNILVTDGGVEGLVIAIRIDTRTETLNGEEVLLTVGAGAILDEVVQHAVSSGWWGIENLSYIPGLVGATPIQNVGAYGVEAKDVIASVRAYNIETGDFENLTNEMCAFGYRDSLFKKKSGKKYIVTQVVYRLSTRAKPQIAYRDLAVWFGSTAPTILEIRNAVIAIRSKKFPDWQTTGTAGSFFKNPIIPKERFEALKKKYPEMPGYALENNSVKVALGWILDSVLGLKGVQEGNVGTYKGQALVLVNNGEATATEIKNFAEKIVHQVKQKTDIDVEWEVTLF